MEIKGEKQICLDENVRVCNSMVLDMMLFEIYVCHVQVWFYKHTRRFAKQNKKRYPRMASWDRVDHRGRHDANLLLKDIREDEGMPSICN